VSAEVLPGALVVGGGLAGAAAAIRLRLAGRPVRLLEREREAHHKVCGEFLSAEGVAHLGALGVDVAALGAVPVRAVRLVAAGQLAEARLPFEARSLTRHALDEALLVRAGALGAEVARGVAARRILPDGQVATTNGDLRAPCVLLATGKHELRGARRAAPGAIRHLVGFKTYFRLRPAERAALAGHTELILFRGGYAGLQPVERETANLCLLVAAGRLAACGGRLPALLEDLAAEVPHLARRLEGAVPLLDRPLAVSGVPYGHLLSGQGPSPALWPVGDQAAVIPSYTGMGMSLALHGAMLAVRALLAGEGVEAYVRALRRDMAGPVERATAVQRLAGDRPEAGGRLVALARRMPALVRLAVGLTRLPPPALRGLGPAG